MRTRTRSRKHLLFTLQGLPAGSRMVDTPDGPMMLVPIIPPDAASPRGGGDASRTGKSRSLPDVPTSPTCAAAACFITIGRPHRF